MITNAKNFAPDRDMIKIYTDQDETITIERIDNEVHVVVEFDPSEDDGSGYEYSAILGQEGETTKL